MRFYARLIPLMLFAQEAQAPAAPSSLLVRYGMQSTATFREVSPLRTRAVRTPFGTMRPSLVRRFQPTARLQTIGAEFAECHLRLLTAYGQKNPPPFGTDAFLAWARKSDPRYEVLGKQMYPEFYFDFAGQSGREYILRRIVISRFRGRGELGGGFVDGEAWYEVSVPIEGTRATYEVKDNALRFTSSGRAQLRIINEVSKAQFEIAFVFLSNRREVSVVTGPIQTD